MKHVTAILLLTVSVGILGGGDPTVRAAKPTPPWPCQVTLRDSAGDKILSDNTGTYVNGVGGVDCTVASDPASTHYGWLALRFGNRSARWLSFPGQALDVDGRAGYDGFISRGTLEVKGLAQFVVWNGDPSYVDILPFRANVSDRQFAASTGQFSGDSNFTGEPFSTGSSSVFVRPLDDCNWDVWSDPAAGPWNSALGDLRPYPLWSTGDRGQRG